MKTVILGIALFLALIFVIRNGFKIFMASQEREIRHRAKQWKKTRK